MRFPEKPRPHFPVLVLVLVLVAVLVPARQSAAAAKPRVGVAQFAGSGEGPIRAKVLKAIKGAAYTIVGAQQIDSTAAKTGVPLDSDDGWRAVARELNVSAFVTGEITRRKATLTVRNGADGGVLGEASFPGASAQKIAAAVAAGFWKQLGPIIKRGRPPAGANARSAITEEAEPTDTTPDEAGAAAPAVSAATEETEPAPPPANETPTKRAPRAADATDSQGAAPDDTTGAEGEGDRSAKPRKKDSKKDSKKDRRGQASSAAANGTAGAKTDEGESGDEEEGRAPLPVALELGIGGRALFRSVSWNQDVQHHFAHYSLNPGPEGAVWLDFFPAALFTGGFAAQIGVFGSFNHGFGVTTQTKSGASLTTSFQDLLIGFKLRFPIGALSPYVSLAYGAQTFKLDVPANAPSSIPSFDYRIGRLGAGARIDLAPWLFADLGAGFVLATDVGTAAGDIGSPALFPRAKAYAVDAGASVGVRVLGPLALRAGADIRQYGLDFHTKQTDTTPIAGGATDRYITVWGGLELVLDGVAHESGGDDGDGDGDGK